MLFWTVYFSVLLLARVRTVCDTVRIRARIGSSASCTYALFRGLRFIEIFTKNPWPGLGTIVREVFKSVLSTRRRLTEAGSWLPDGKWLLAAFWSRNKESNEFMERSTRSIRRNQLSEPWHQRHQSTSVEGHERLPRKKLFNQPDLLK